MPRNNVSGPFSFMPHLLSTSLLSTILLKKNEPKKVTSKNIRKTVSMKVGKLSANGEIIVSPDAPDSFTKKLIYRLAGQNMFVC